MTSAKEGFFEYGNERPVYIKFNEVFDYAMVNGIAKIKGTTTATNQYGASVEVPLLEMIDIFTLYTHTLEIIKR